MFGNSFRTLINRLWHIMPIFQNDNVKIDQAQIVMGMFGKENESFSDLKLKVFGMCWRRLYRVLDSSIVNTRSWQKCMHMLKEKHHIFGQDLVLTMQESSAL